MLSSGEPPKRNFAGLNIFVKFIKTGFDKLSHKIDASPHLYPF